MHGVCTTTGSCRFTRYLSSRNNECIICFGNKICVAIMIIMTMTDKDILAFDIFFFSDIPCITGQEWVENHGYIATCEHKASVTKIS